MYPSVSGQALINGDLSYFEPYVPSDAGSGQVLGAQTAPAPIYYDNNTGGFTENPNNVNIGAGSTSTPSYNPDDLAYVDNQSNILRSLLGDISDTTTRGVDQIRDDFNISLGKLNTNYGNRLSDFAMAEEDNKRGKVSSLGKVDTNANTLANSLRRLLGMASGANSSAYQVAAPGAIAKYASGERNDVLENFGVNDRNLSIDKTRAEGEWETAKGDLNREKDSRYVNFTQDANIQKQSILEQLANLAADRQSIVGGTYTDIMRAQSPYQDRINALTAKNNTVFDKYNKDYTVGAPTVSVPELADFTVDQAGINANQQNGGNSPTSPYSYYMAPLRKKFSEG